MSSTAGTASSTDAPFTVLRDNHRMLKLLLEITPGGSSVHLPAMTDKPDPDRDQLIVKMYNFLNDCLKSNPATQSHKKLRAEHEERRDQLDEELDDITAELSGGLSGGHEMPVEEVLMMMVRYKRSLGGMKELSEECRFIQQANKEAVEALKEEMRKW
jgi:hypothetical protein